MDPNVQLIVEEICYYINVIMSQNPNENYAKANERLNTIVNVEISKNIKLYLDVSMILISDIPSKLSSELSIQWIINYGLNIIENLVKYQWYDFDQESKIIIKNFTINCCKQKLKNFCQNSLIFNDISTSRLINNTCSRLMTEIFLREWPNNWPDFLPNITENCSLVTLFTLLNMSDYLSKLLLPINPNRRKEITKVLTLEKNKNIVLDYISKCLNSDEFSEEISPDYKKMIMVQSLETLNSLLEWYPLNERILNDIITIVTQMIGFEDQFSLRMKTLSLRCIQNVIKRSIKQNDDSILVSDVFFDLDPKKFPHYLVTEMLNQYFNLVKMNDSNNDFVEFFIVLIDILVDIVCKVINLYNQESYHRTLRTNCLGNQLFWSQLIDFCLECLLYDNVHFDDILLRFFNFFSRSRFEQWEDNTTLMSLFNSIPFKLMSIIGCLKLEPKPESSASKLINFYNTDSYENYIRIFKENRCKYIEILNNLLNNHPQICRKFTFALLRDFLGPVENLECDIQTNVKSWKAVASLCSTLIPKQNFSLEDIEFLETYFSRLLEIIHSSSSLQTLNSVLSCISSMSSLYSSFSDELIKKLIQDILFLVVKTKETSDQEIFDLHNHLNALFIKLTKNCVTVFLPHFHLIQSFIDDLIVKEKISFIQTYFLYEGLFILSNYLTVEEQKMFFLNHFIPKISWINDYDFGPDAIKFFTDIGLATEPQLNINQLPTKYYPLLGRMSVVLNLLIRLYKRIDLNRCLEILWPTILYQLTPFIKVITSVHKLWAVKSNVEICDKLCHPFYQKYMFEEIPCFYMNMILSELNRIFPIDKYKFLMKKWDRQTLPPPELIGYHMQHKIWVFYSQSINLLNVAFSYLLFFYMNQPSLEIIIEDFIKTNNSLICENMKFLPIVVYHDLTTQYFQFLANYLPRSEKFLLNSGCMDILMEYTNFLYCMLNENLKIIQHEKEISKSNSSPYTQTFSSFNSMPFQTNDNCTNLMEIYMKATVHSICSDFISFLNGLFSPSKIIANKHELSQQITTEIGEEMDEDIYAKDNELVINRNNIGESVLNGDYNEEGLLSKFLITFYARPLVTVVIGCLQWPINNLRIQICEINHKLIQALISRNMINSTNAFFDLAGQILQAITQTERSDFETFTHLANLLFLIYEKFVYKNNLTEAVNPKLSKICGSHLNEWNKVSNCIRHGGNTKKTQKIFRNLLEDVLVFKELSLVHSMDKPDVKSLGELKTDKDYDKNNEDVDIGFLSWLE